MKRAISAFVAAIIAVIWAAPAEAGEFFGGLYVHDVKTPLTLSGVEDGVDVQLGWRSDPLGDLRLQPYAFVGLNSAGTTHYAALGISRRFGSKLYVRPGLGIAVHTGSAREHKVRGNDRIEFGSRFLFEPEIAIGTQINDRLSIEASWVHMSNGQILSRQNPGIDNLGVRVNYRLR